MIIRWASTHLKDEQDYCALAMTCTHDGAPVYGIAPDNRTARLFLDTCDVHEYNCDHKTNYRPCIEHPVTEISTRAVRDSDTEELLKMKLSTSSNSPNKIATINAKRRRKKIQGFS
ncbi:uncharacterized protein LOC134748309 [Cydia strobilella]|uniref:uncharacterized protein LOC134748309 n=1 Tax=Cydia strobilella TaxID=1100964 RepID=UPI003006D814